MTESKHLKARIRARMARTGERYMTARRHVVGGGRRARRRPRLARCAAASTPTAPAIANVLAHHGARACRRRWCSASAAAWAPATSCGSSRRTAAPTLVLGFRNQWQYPDRWAAKTLERLGVAFDAARDRRREGRGGDSSTPRSPPAARRSRRVDRQEIGYWHLPAHPSGRGGYPVVVYGGRRRPGAHRRPQPRAADRRRASGSTPRAPASAPTSTGSW